MIYFNNYLSNKLHLENINSIIFHNIISEDKTTNLELYQSLLSYLFDNYYEEKNENIKYQTKMLTNIQKINI